MPRLNIKFKMQSLLAEPSLTSKSNRRFSMRPQNAARKTEDLMKKKTRRKKPFEMFGWVEQAFQNKMLSKTQPWIFEMNVNINIVALFLALAKFSLWRSWQSGRSLN